MVSIVIVTHGNLGTELMATAELMTGPLDGVLAVSLKPECSLEDFTNRMRLLLEQHGAEHEVLILADLLGGTPANVAAGLAQRGGISVVTGVNLSMLLEVYMSRRNADVEELTSLAVQAGREAVHCLAGM